MCLMLYVGSRCPLNHLIQRPPASALGLRRASRRQLPARLAAMEHVYLVASHGCSWVLGGSAAEASDARRTLLSYLSETVRRKGKPLLYFRWLGPDEGETLAPDDETLSLQDIETSAVWGLVGEKSFYATVAR